MQKNDKLGSFPGDGSRSFIKLSVHTARVFRAFENALQRLAKLYDGAATGHTCPESQVGEKNGSDRIRTCNLAIMSRLLHH